MKATFTQPPLLVASREAAQMLGVSQRTLWHWTHSGKIPAIRAGRIVRYSVDDLRAYIDSHRVTSGGRDE